MAARDPRVDAYIEQAAPFARPILRRLRAVVHEVCPDVEEAIKWRVPSFEYKGPYCGMAAFKAHVTFGFWKASLLEAQGLPLSGDTAWGHLGCIRGLDDLPSDATMRRLLRAAATLNDHGVTAPRAARAKKPPPRVPAAFKAAIQKNRKALAAFQAFSPSHKREYVEWIAEAKTEGTRARRIATAIEWLSDGKSRNWKYERR
jgi:hypothetical protein